MLKMEFFSAICYLVFLLGLPDTVFSADRIIFPNKVASLFNELNTTDSNLDKSVLLQEDNVCRMQSGEKGECLPLNQCPELLDYIKSRNGIHTPGTADFLKKRICKLLVRSVNVCCITKTTPVLPLPSGQTKIDTRQPSNGSLPSIDDCGYATIPKVSRGNDFKHGTHPWLVGVGYPRDNETFKVECGGTLITKKHVITAAHCFYRDEEIMAPNFTHVILGEHSLSKAKERDQPIVLRIAEMKHPGYNQTIHYNDISLLVLEKEITFTTYIRPACLPLDSYIESFDLSKTSMTVVGWGRTYYGEREGTDEPLEAQIPLIPKPECRKAYDFAPEVPLDDTQICLAEDGKDACQGDSGGPLLYQDLIKFGRQFLIGVVAFGVECGNPMFPGVYTYVPKYMPWILENL